MVLKRSLKNVPVSAQQPQKIQRLQQQWELEDMRRPQQSQDNKMQDTVEGYINHIIFRNEDNGYTVLSMIVDGEELTCVGFFQYISEAKPQRLRAVTQSMCPMDSSLRLSPTKPRFRRMRLPWNDIWVPEQSKVLVLLWQRRIVRRFGEDTLRIMDEEPERLAEIKGISERKAREIVSRWKKKSGYA